VPIVAIVASGGRAIPVVALNYSLFVWGVYMVAEAAVTLLIPRRTLLRRALVSLAVAASLLLIALPFGRVLLNTYSAVATRLAGIAATDPSHDNPGAIRDAVPIAQAAASESDPLSLLNLGSAQYYEAQEWKEQTGSVERYGDAIKTYTSAINASPQGSPVRALAHYNLALAYLGFGDRELARQNFQAAQQICLLPNNLGDTTCLNIREQLK
jgi:tetratricopeptide (TPR) repeat protein